MAYEFKKLGEVEALEEVPDGANALIEVNGDIKRVPGSNLGGGGGIKTAIIKSSNYDNAIAGLQTTQGGVETITYSCVNMTFEEAYATMAAGEPLAVMFMLSDEGVINVYGMAVMDTTGYFAVPLIACQEANMEIAVYWTADGLSTSAPEINGK